MTQLSARDRVAAEIVRDELRRRGLQVKDLGDRFGVSARHVSNLLARNVRSRAIEVQIELLLGRALWSTEEEFAVRRLGDTEAQPGTGRQSQQNKYEIKNTEDGKDPAEAGG